MLIARVIGRSDDARFHVLRQDGPGGAVFRWPAEGEDAAGAAALITLTPVPPGPPAARASNQFQTLVAGSYLFLRSAQLELVLFFPLLPALPPAVEVTLEILPAEVNEGVEPVAPGVIPQ